jgi:hypothetical protein
MVPDSASSPAPECTAAAGSATQRARAWRRAARLRRLFLAVAAIGQTGVATYYFSRVLPYHGATVVELGLLVLFALLFLWISVGFWVAVTGFVLRVRGGDRLSLLQRHPDEELSRTHLARTAVVMPIYHEPVERTLNGLRACFLSLQRTGQLAHFDFFILSDSRDPQVWLSEREAWYRLCEELGASGRLFYRHRPVNLHYKSGNIADFLRRWGRAYRYMVVLDADSLMEGDTLVKMVRLMEREPQVGILQTSPAIINAQSLYQRAVPVSTRSPCSPACSSSQAMSMARCSPPGSRPISWVRRRTGGITRSSALGLSCATAGCTSCEARGFSAGRYPVTTSWKPPSWDAPGTRCGWSPDWLEATRNRRPRWRRPGPAARSGLACGAGLVLGSEPGTLPAGPCGR